MDLLQGRVAVVTGAASGIGLAIASALVAEGMHVAMADIDAGAVGAHAERLGAAGFAVDVRDQESVEALGRAAVERFGALHVAVNNAGIVNMGNSWELPLEEWHRV